MNGFEKVLSLFGLAIVADIAVAAALPGQLTRLGNMNVAFAGAELFGAAIATLVLGGIIPMIAWAVMRFRPSASNKVMTMWAGMILVAAWLQYYGQAPH